MGLFDDATRRAVRRQLEAMGSQAFRLEIRNERGETRYESLVRAELLAETNRLRRENRASAAIGIRSEERTGLVLVRGLDEAGLERMGSDGLLAALVTHVGEHRYEAWVRLDPTSFGKGYHDALAQVLADRYAAAPQPAGWDMYGRLAGFAHPEHMARYGAGRAPVVKIIAEPARLAPGAAAFRLEVEDYMALNPDMRRPVRAHEPAREASAPEMSPDPARHDEAYIDRRATALARADARGAPFDHRRAEFIALLQTMRADPAFSDQDALAMLARTGTRGQGQQGLPADPAAYAQATVRAVRRALATSRGSGHVTKHAREMQDLPGR
jgi:hypothetical protein